MSGNDEKPKEEGNLICPHCGGRNFRYISYGYMTEEVNPSEKRYWPGDWEDSGDGEGWECANCYHRAPDHVQEYLNSVPYYRWR
jgi:hypothetical protein